MYWWRNQAVSTQRYIHLGSNGAKLASDGIGTFFLRRQTWLVRRDKQGGQSVVRDGRRGGQRVNPGELDAEWHAGCGVLDGE